MAIVLPTPAPTVVITIIVYYVMSELTCVCIAFKIQNHDRGTAFECSMGTGPPCAQDGYGQGNILYMTICHAWWSANSAASFKKMGQFEHPHIHAVGTAPRVSAMAMAAAAAAEAKSVLAARTVTVGARTRPEGGGGIARCAIN